MNDSKAFALALGILFSAAAVFYLVYVLALRFFGKKAEGFISGYEIYDDVPYGMTCPLISFSDEKGNVHTGKYRLSSPIKSHKPGRKLTVYYFPKDTSKFIVWDISLLITFLLIAFGGGFFFLLSIKTKVQ